MANEIKKVLVGGVTYDIIDAGAARASHTHDYLPLAGGTLTGDLIINAPHRDNYYASNLCRHFYSGTPTEFVIKTKIKYVSGVHMPVIRIYGYAYGAQCPIELRIGFYIYGGNLGWCGVVSTGAWKPDVYLYKYTENSVEYVAVGLKGSCYFCGFQVDCQIGASGSFGNNISIDGWTTTHNGADTTQTLIPAVGTNNCIKVDYKTMKTDISGNAATATSATKATQDESGNNIKATYGASISLASSKLNLVNKNSTVVSSVNATEVDVAKAGTDKTFVTGTTENKDVYNAKVTGTVLFLSPVTLTTDTVTPAVSNGKATKLS